MRRYHNAVCARCLEPGCDREPFPGCYMHSGCLVIWLVFAAEMGIALGDVPWWLGLNGDDA
jgi:hypothetical protein